jgi:protein-S-isoprenylcysteine O-methyltransferase Ste14
MESTFWLVLAVLLWGILHSLLASVETKAFILGILGEKLGRFYRLAYNVLAGLSFLPILAMAAILPDSQLYSLPLPWSALMVFGEFLALVVLVIGLRQTDIWEFLGLWQLTIAPSSGHTDNLPMETAQGHLVTTGLYHYVRHPLYSAGIVFIWLLPVMMVNVLAINIALTIYVVVGAYFEERKLRREFGQEYADYAAVTPMFIPFLKGNKMTR